MVYLGLIIIFMRQQSKSLTPSALSRISRWTFVIQSLIDLLSFGAHFTFSLMAEERVGLSLIATSMMASVLAYQEGVSKDPDGLSVHG
jgi:transmembrane E3 ubiquitin-protein ligase